MLRGAVFSWTQCTIIFLLYGLFIIQQKCLILYATMLWRSVVFGRLFVKRLALCYQTMVLSCLSATLVYCGQMVGWIKMKLGMKVGRPRHRPHCVRWGPSYPLPPKRAQPPIFRPMSVVAKQLPILVTDELLLLKQNLVLWKLWSVFTRGQQLLRWATVWPQ